MTGTVRQDDDGPAGEQQLLGSATSSSSSPPSDTSNEPDGTSESELQDSEDEIEHVLARAEEHPGSDRSVLEK